MECLLDTCSLIFFLEGNLRLPKAIVQRIREAKLHCHISMVSLWEIAIKTGVGKLEADYATRDDLPELLANKGFKLISPEWPAMRRASLLPQHHRDPFDRLLVAECQLRGWPIISSDSRLDAYGITRLWG